MGVPFLMIDGYNLLHGAGLAKLRYAQGDLERARQRLLGMLCEKLSEPEQMRCTVVFDAQNAPGDVSRESKHHEIRVLFAPAGSDADTVIEELIAKHPAAKQAIVVSADHRLHKAARRKGATPIDSEPFWERLQKRPDARTALIDENDVKGPKTKPPPKTKRETENWLKEFGDISVDEIAAEVRAESQSVPGGSPWERHLSDLERIIADDHETERFLKDPRRQRPAE